MASEISRTHNRVYWLSNELRASLKDIFISNLPNDFVQAVPRLFLSQNEALNGTNFHENGPLMDSFLNGYS